MSRAARAAAAGLLPAVIVALAGCGAPPPPEPTAEVEEEAPALPVGEALRLPVDLYFPAAGGRLGSERHELEIVADPSEQARMLVEALLAGPRGDVPGLYRPLPPEVEVAGVYLSPQGVAFVDLRTPEATPPPASGSTEERQVVYSLVNTLALNLAEVQRVVLLWNGRQPLTFAGHLDTSHPLAPEPRLVRR